MRDQVANVRGVLNTARMHACVTVEQACPPKGNHDWWRACSMAETLHAKDYEKVILSRFMRVILAQGPC